MKVSFTNVDVDYSIGTKYITNGVFWLWNVGNWLFSAYMVYLLCAFISGIPDIPSLAIVVSLLTVGILQVVANIVVLFIVSDKRRDAFLMIMHGIPSTIGIGCVVSFALILVIGGFML